MAFVLLVAGVVLILLGLFIPVHLLFWLGVAAAVVGVIAYFAGFHGAGFSRRRV